MIVDGGNRGIIYICIYISSLLLDYGLTLLILFCHRAMRDFKVGISMGYPWDIHLIYPAVTRHFGVRRVVELTHS